MNEHPSASLYSRVLQPRPLLVPSTHTVPEMVSDQQTPADPAGGSAWERLSTGPELGARSAVCISSPPTGRSFFLDPEEAWCSEQSIAWHQQSENWDLRIFSTTWELGNLGKHH